MQPGIASSPSATSPQPARPVTVQDCWNGVAFLAILGAVAWLYWPPLTWLIFKWKGDEYYSHGPFLILVSAFLIWLARPALARGWQSRAGMDRASGVWLAVGLLINFAATVADVQFIQALSLPVTLLGLVRLCGGKALARVLAFPLLFLCMAVPLSGVLVQTITVPLQNLGASLAASTLGLAGMTIERQGVNLFTPKYNFVVEVACSGLKTTIVLVTMAMVLAHLTPRLSLFARCLVVFLSVPVALFANSLRITFIVVLGYFYGVKVAEGALHGFSGVFLFGVSLAMLLGIISGLERFGFVSTTEIPVATPPVRQSRPASRWAPQLVALCCLFLARWAGNPSFVGGSESRSAPKIAPRELPSQLSAWRGKTVKVEKVVYDVLDPDFASQASYTLAPAATRSLGWKHAPEVQVLVIYSRKWKNFHSPVMCLRAMGWEISDEQPKEVSGKVQGRTQSLTLSLLTGQNQGHRTQLGYYYMSSGSQVHGWVPTMAKLAASRVLRRSDGVAEVQFGFDPALIAPNGAMHPDLSQLILAVSNAVQDNLRAEEI